MGLNNVLSHRLAIKELQKGGMCPPRFADLHTSNRCNHGCVGCAYASHLDNAIMNEKDHTKIVSDLMRIGVTAFDFAGGGEPLVLPYIENIFDMIHEKDCNYAVITNGSLLNSSRIEKIIRQATYIRVSLEAVNSKLYQQYKQVGPKMWDVVTANIENLVAEKKAQNSSCEIGLKFSVGKSLRGLDVYKEGIELGKKMQVDNVQFKALRHEPEELSYEEKVEEDSFLSSLAPDLFVRKWIVPADDGDIPQCWLNPLHVVVDYNGDAYLCCYYYYRNNHCIGNMLRDSIEDFWFKKAHKDLVKGIEKDECAKVDCKFFRHHKIVSTEFCRGKVDFL